MHVPQYKERTPRADNAPTINRKPGSIPSSSPALRFVHQARVVSVTERMRGITAKSVNEKTQQAGQQIPQVSHLEPPYICQTNPNPGQFEEPEIRAQLTQRTPYSKLDNVLDGSNKIVLDTHLTMQKAQEMLKRKSDGIKSQVDCLASKAKQSSAAAASLLKETQEILKRSNTAVHKNISDLKESLSLGLAKMENFCSSKNKNVGKDPGK